MSSESTASTGFYEFLAWAEENRKQLLIGFLTLLALAAVLTIYFWQRNQTEIEASTALLKLRPPPSASENSPEPAASEYLKIAESYRGTDAADRALLLAAGSLFADGKYAEAATRFEQFLSDNANHPLAPTAAYGVASALEAQGKQGEALAGYQKVIERHAESAVADAAKMAVARIHVAKDEPEQALKVIEELTLPSRTGGPDAQAAALKEEILSDHPELAKAAAPPAVSTNAAPAASVTNAAPAPASDTGEAATPPPAPAPEGQ